MKNLCLKLLSYSCGPSCVPRSALSLGATNPRPTETGIAVRSSGGRAAGDGGQGVLQEMGGLEPAGGEWVGSDRELHPMGCVGDAEGRCSQEPT